MRDKTNTYYAQPFYSQDPSLPDNPIVYCSDGFCKLSGYSRKEIVGRNCRFLQGPLTDQAAVDIIRQGVKEGRDISVCLLNYKADGSPFWNQFFGKNVKTQMLLKHRKLTNLATKHLLLHKTNKHSRTHTQKHKTK